MPDALAYVRQSKARPGETAETSLSLDAQEAAIRRHAERHGYIVLAAVRDHDELGADPDRPGLRALLDRVRPGMTVLLYKWDRLARDLLLQESVIRPLERQGVAFVSVTEPGPRLTRVLFGAFAEEWKAQHAQRVRDALRQQAARGEPHGPPPWGLAKVDGRLAFDPDDLRVAVLREVARRFLAGASVRSLAAYVREQTGQAVGRRTVLRWLANPAYAGGVRDGAGRVTWGAHPAVWDRATWDAIQALRARRPRSPREKPYASWLEGFVTCGCGAPMYLTRLGPRSIGFRCRAYIRQHAGEGEVCAMPRHGIGRRRLERFAAERLLADAAAMATVSPAAAARRARQRLRDADPGRAAERARLERERDRLRDRQAAVNEAALDRRLDRVEANRRYAAVQERLEAVEADLARGAAPPDPASLRAASAAAAAAARDLAGTWEVLLARRPQALRAALAALGGRVVVAEEIRIDYAGASGELAASADASA